MIDWTQGYSARYYLAILDKYTLRDIDRMEITGGSIKRSLTELRESADIDCTDYDSNTEQYIRVWLDIKQGAESSHTPLFTGLATSPSNTYNGRLKKNSVQCYSLLKIAQDILLPRGWYAPVDANSGKLIKNLLSVIGTEIKIGDNSPDLSQAIIAEQGENQLSMVDKILDAIKWNMRVDGNGTISIEPYNKNSLILFDANKNDIIETDIEITYDWYNAPNVVRCSLDDYCAIAKDENSNSPLSIANRGREVWVEVSNVQLGSNQTLAEYANAALKEYQTVATNIRYDRRYYPGLYPGDVISINYPAQRVAGNFMISDQTVTLGYNAKTSEEVMEI